MTSTELKTITGLIIDKMQEKFNNMEKDSSIKTDILSNDISELIPQIPENMNSFLSFVVKNIDGVHSRPGKNGGIIKE